MTTKSSTAGRTPQAPGRNDRRGIGLMEVSRMFATEAKAEAWFETRRWPDSVTCPYCGGAQVAQPPSKPRRPKYRCTTRKDGKACGQAFSVKTDTIMHKSTLPLSKWGMGIYLMNTNLKGVSSMKLHRDLEITQKTAWHLAHRIREAWRDNPFKFTGPVEIDEVYIGGKRTSKTKSERAAMPKGEHTVKGVVVGAKDRATNKVQTQVVRHAGAVPLKQFVHERTARDASVFTDEHPAYRGINRSHAAVKHSAEEYVRGAVHTNGIESHWSMLKRGHKGTFHHFSLKHLPRYIIEFAARHNARGNHTADQMGDTVARSVGRRLRYQDLIGPRHTRQPMLF